MVDEECCECCVASDAKAWGDCDRITIDSIINVTNELKLGNDDTNKLLLTALLRLVINFLFSTTSSSSSWRLWSLVVVAAVLDNTSTVVSNWNIWHSGEHPDKEAVATFVDPDDESRGRLSIILSKLDIKLFVDGDRLTRLLLFVLILTGWGWSGGVGSLRNRWNTIESMCSHCTRWRWLHSTSSSSRILSEER